MAEVGQRALAGVPPNELLCDIARSVRETLVVDGCVILTLGRRATLSAGVCDGEVVETLTEKAYSLSADDRNVWIPSRLTTYDLAAVPSLQTALGKELRHAGLSSVTVVMIEQPDGQFGVLRACRVQGDPPGRGARDFLQSVANVIGSSFV